METLRQKTARGLMWGMLNNGTTQVLNLVIGIFLARLLSPSDYGIVGVLTIFTTIAGNLQSAGFTQALINIRKPTDNDYNSVFWFNVIMSVAMYAILFCCAPLIARYFRQECLIVVSRVVFLTFVISSLGIVHNAYLTKNLMVREMAVAGIVALAVSGIVGIALALRGMAYWSLVWQQITFISVANIMRLRYSRWRPSLHIDFGPVRRMKGFAIKILLTNIISTVSQNVLTVIFGRLFPIMDVGHYTQANKWSTMGHTVLSGTIGQVAQPALRQAADSGESETDMFRKILRFTALLSFPALFGLAIVADEFIVTALSAKWSGCVPLLRIICIGAAFMPIYTLYQNLVISKGRSDIYLWCNIVQIAVQVAVVLLFSARGIEPMVTVYTLFNILYLFVWQHYTGRITGLRLAAVMRDICPYALSAAAVMLLTYYVTQPIQGRVLLLGARIAMGAGLYFAVVKIIGKAPSNSPKGEGQ